MRLVGISIFTIAVLLSPSVLLCAELELGLGLNSPVLERHDSPWSSPSPDAELPTLMLSWFNGGAHGGNQFGLFLNRKTASTSFDRHTETALGAGWHRKVAEAGLFSLRVGAGAGLSFVTNGKGNATFLLSPEIDIVTRVNERFAVLFGFGGWYYVAGDGYRVYPFASGEAFTVGFRYTAN